MVEVVAMFWYIGRLLDQPDDDYACKFCLGETGDTDLTGSGRPQVGGNVLQGGGQSGTTVWFRYVGHLGRNGEEGRRGIHSVPQIDHG